MNGAARHPSGFTLIELVMVILLIAILAAVALPNLFDFRMDAKNSATYGALGGLRTAVIVAKASINLRESPTVPVYPTIQEMQSNLYLPLYHPMLGALPDSHIMEGSTGVPQNPWTLQTVPLWQKNSIWDCTSMTKSFVLSGVGQQNIGWCYDQVSGDVWANSTLNGGAFGYTENNY